MFRALTDDAIAGWLRERFADEGMHARDAKVDGVELTAWSFNDAAQATFASAGFRPMIVRYDLSG